MIENILKNYHSKELEESRFREYLIKSRISIDPPIKNIGNYSIVIELAEEVIDMKVSVGRSLEEAKKGV